MLKKIASAFCGEYDDIQMGKEGKIMAKIFQNVSELVGRTPLLALSERLSQKFNLKGRLVLKLEYFNPAGSVKDRIAKTMIEVAEASGVLHEGVEIIEPTSGNTGIGLAAIAASKGYKATFVMPENMSLERRKLLQIYGASIVLTPAEEGMAGAIKKAEELASNLGAAAFVPGQFENPANPQAHEETTGPEIWSDTEGLVDVFVSSVGTGGTLSGTGRYLKTMKPSLRVVAVEPAGSAVLSGGEKGPHGIQGIGAGFIPDTLDTTVYDEVVQVTDEEAVAAAKLLAQSEGLLVGLSSGAAFWAALKLAKRDDCEAKSIVVLLPDTGERYLSTSLFEGL